MKELDRKIRTIQREKQAGIAIALMVVVTVIAIAVVHVDLVMRMGVQ